VKRYYCIVNTLAVPARDIVVLNAAEDDGARLETGRVEAAWPGYETIELYDGERLVCVLANPAHGFPAAMTPNRPLAA
jgi:hypothetical protein